MMRSCRQRSCQQSIIGLTDHPSFDRRIKVQIKLLSFAYTLGLLLLVLTVVQAQELRQVYMINHNTAVHYHVFSLVDRASLIEAIDNMVMAAFPCGTDLVTSRIDATSIVFHFQLYRACPLIESKKNENLITMIDEKTKQKSRNQVQMNIADLVKNLQNKQNFDNAFEVTFMTEDEQVRRLVDLEQRSSRPKDVESLFMNFSNHKPLRRPKRLDLDSLDIDNVNATEITSNSKPFYLGSNSENEEEADLDYYSEMNVDEIEMESEILIDVLKSSRFAHEGCISQRLQPVDAFRGMRPFSGNGYILNGVIREVLNMIKTKAIDYYIVNVNYRPVKCFVPCNSLVPLASSTTICGGIQPNDFETNSQNELWSFVNSEQIDDALAASKYAHTVGSPYFPPTRVVNKDDNFRIVVGSGQNSSNHYAYFSSREPRLIVPMIISLYFQHTSTTCELVFQHRIHGITGAELIVSTQHLEHHTLLVNPNEEEEEADDWVRPTLRASFKPVRDDLDQWTTSRVPIGQMLYPTRIRIECHTAQQQRDPSLLNVECNVDDIELVNCDEEIWKADVCSSKQSKKYLCHRSGSQKCIDYADVCDMHPECEGDEDEDNAIHKCTLVPPGARCNFEQPSDTGCSHWKFFSSSGSTLGGSNASQHLQRVSLADTSRLPAHGLPPGEYIYHGSKRTAGHFLLFAPYGLSNDHQSNGEILYTYAVTPAFPPTSLATSLPDSPSYKTCMVRFFYCHTGTSTFQLVLENRSDFSHKEVLLTPPKTIGSDPCVWQKASAPIPHQETEYRLKIAFGKLYKQQVSVTIDDFTMTPNCFLELNFWSARFVPNRLKIQPCETKNCTESNGDQHESVTSDDKRSWLVPTNGLYHIQLFGAAGGYLPGQETNNFGGIVAANVQLQRNQELSFVVGQMGINPCTDERKTFSTGQEKSNLERLWRLICTNGSSSSTDLEFARRDVQNLFGSSGGGATALFLDNNLIAVAGAGGGLFPEAFMQPSDSKLDPAGGTIFDLTNKSTSKQSKANWSAGNGANFGLLQPTAPSNCADCAQMSGYSIVIKDRRQFLGGQCPRNRHYNITGASGGGGASCGSGAGGGAGYQGGNAGYKSHAEGGTSAFLAKNAEFGWVKGINAGAGSILIVRCSLKCPANSTCAFESPKPGVEAEQFCQCLNGKKVYAKGSCSPSDLLTLIHQIGKTISQAVNVDSNVGIFLFIFLLFILFLIPICTCYMYMRLRYDCGQGSPLMRRIKFWLFPNKRNEEFGDMFEMNSRAGGNSNMERSRSTIGGGNLIKENPIYERLVMMELPHISRHFIQLKKSIGHGAFGEVYEGIFHLNDTITRVAVKTLPMDLNPETDCDFETEARLLNQFDHPNIVRFYGVSFEQLPKQIILEYLEGGDLRNFLRECRPKTNALLDENQPLTMIDLIHMALDVAHGCAYLEHSKFIHRDIAARNCLLTTKGPGRVVKIADFGMARDIFSSEYYRKGGRAFLAVKWMPPEGFLDGIFNSKTDVWSYGVLLWETFSMGYMPYTLRQNQEVMQLIVAGGRLEPPVGVPEEIYKQMLCCWNTEPNERPNFDKLVDFFTNLATNPQMLSLPVPPILYRQSQLTPTSTPSTTRSSIPPLNDDIVASQATISTAIASSMTESTTNSSVSMPTQGEGINHNVFPPYQSRFSRPLMEMQPNQHRLIRDSSLSSHDDSTLHDTCSVKQSPYRIEKDALKAMQGIGNYNISSSETKPFLPTTSMNPALSLKKSEKCYASSAESPSVDNANEATSPLTESGKVFPEEQTSPLV